MSARADVEIVKIARLLGDRPERFAYLADVPVEDLRALRVRATDVLFDANRVVYERIAAASKLVPTAVTIAVAQKVFGPMLCARIAGALEPSRAVDLVRGLPTEFLADLAAELDPRRVAPILAAIPADRVVEVGTELLRRGDHITMGRFVGDMPVPSVRAMVDAADAEDIVRLAMFTENLHCLADVLAELPAERRSALADLAADNLDALGPVGEALR